MTHSPRLVAAPCLAALLLVFSQLAPAEITVTPADYADGSFIYLLPTTDPTAYHAAHDAAFSSGFGTVARGVSAWYPTYLYYFDGSRPSFTYRFDFTGAGDTIKNVSITDRLTHFGDGGFNLGRSTVSYSTDGINFQRIRQLQSPVSGVNDSIDRYVLPLNDATQFYYRVEMQAIPGDFNGILNSAFDQWARCAQNGSSTFIAAFSNSTPPSLQPLVIPNNTTMTVVLEDAIGIEAGSTPAASAIQGSGRDGEFGDGNETDVLADATQSWDAGTSTLTLSFSSELPADLYQVTIDRASFTNSHGLVLPKGANVVAGFTPDFTPPVISALLFDGTALPTDTTTGGTLSAAATSAGTLVSATFSYARGPESGTIGTDADPSDGFSVPFDSAALAPGRYLITAEVSDTDGLSTRLTKELLLTEPEPESIAFNCSSDRIIATDFQHNGFFGSAVAVDGTTAAVIGNNALYVFELTGGTWTEVQKRTGTGVSTADGWGSDIAIEGDLIAVGAETDDSALGSVFLFGRDVGGPGNWGELKRLTHTSRVNGSYFGQSLSLHGDTLAVGSRTDSRNLDRDGAVLFVFERNAGGPDNWGVTKEIRASDERNRGALGREVALHNDTLVATDPFRPGDAGDQAGAVYVFRRHAGGPDNWGELRIIEPSDAAASRQWGSSVALFGDTLAVGTILDDPEGVRNNGTVYLFQEDLGGAGNWGERKRLLRSELQENANFGEWLALRGDTLVVASDNLWPDPNVSNPGAAVLFQRDAGGPDQWGEVQVHSVSGVAFGSAVALDDGILIVGAPRTRLANPGGQHGAAHLFNTDPSPPTLGALAFTSNLELAVPVLDDCAVPGGQNPVVTSLLASGGDGTFEDGNETELLATLTTTAFDDATARIVLTLDSPLLNDTYQVTIDPASVVDLVGTTLAADANTSTGVLNGPVITEFRFGGTPLPGIVRLSGTLSVAATAANSLASASFYLDGQLIATDDDPSNGLSLPLDVSAFERGTYTLRVDVTDQSGFVSTFSQTVELDPFLITSFSPDNLDDDENFGARIAIRDNLLAIGAPEQDANGLRDAGVVYLYERDPITRAWTFVKEITADVPVQDKRFGKGVAIDGDILAVSAPAENVGGLVFAGKVFLYQRNLGGADNWGFLTSVSASDALVSQQFGWTVALQDGLLAVGSDRMVVDGFSLVGAVYLYERNEGGANAWGEIKKLTVSDPTHSIYFGRNIAIDGDTIAVAGEQYPVNGNRQQGAVYLFERDAGGPGNWGEVRKVTSSDGARSDFFGRGLALDGDLLAVGAPEHDFAPGFDQGSVYLFGRDEGGPGNWGEFRKIPAPILTNRGGFGDSIEFGDGMMVVSAPTDSKWGANDDRSSHFARGSVFVFDRNNDFALANRIVSPNSGSSDGFGGRIGVQGQIIVASSPREDVQAQFDQRGRVYIFDGSAPDIPSVPPSLGSPFFDSYHALVVPVIDESPLPALTPVLTSFLASGGDGTFGDGNELDLLAASTVTFDPATNLLRVASSVPLTNDAYQAVFDPTSIVDSAGDPLPADQDTIVASQVLLTSFTIALDEASLTEGGEVTGTITLAEEWFEDFTVTLGSTRSSDIDTGPAVTIPAGQTTGAFTIRGIDDDRLNAPIDATIKGTAPASSSASTTVTVLDDDWPMLTLTLSRSTIAETAGPNALVGTLTRDPVLAQGLNITLSNSLPDAITVPSGLNFQSGQATATFLIGAIDNGDVDGPRTAEITATANALGTTVGTSNIASLDIGDDEGFTLELTHSAAFLIEGTSANFTLRNLSGNVPSDTEITITVDDATELDVPATVTILEGTDQVAVPVTALADADGIQPIVVSAEGAGFSPSELTLVVTDMALPDLTVVSVTAPALLETEANFLVTYRVENPGGASTVSPISQRVYLSTNPTLDNDDQLLTQSEFTAPLAPGQPFELSQNLVAPRDEGSYYLIVATDALNTTVELFENNNALATAVPFTVQAAYSATVAADQESYPANSPVTFAGSATLRAGGPAALVQVDLHITKGGSLRIISALTDSNGDFTTTWRPLPGEGGDFSVGATHPGTSSAPVQDSFVILAINSSGFATDAVTFDEGAGASTGGQLTNPSSVELTGLTTELLGVPSGLNVTPALSSTTLAAGGSIDLDIDLSADPGFAKTGTILVRVTSAEGVSIDIPVTVSVTSLVASLVVDPSSLDCAVLRGGQKVPEFVIRNTGGAPTGPIDVSIPGIPWMNLVSPSPLPSIEPGGETTVSLALTPGPNVSLTLFQGNLAINSAAGAGVALPFSFRVVSDLVGDLEIEVVNEFYYFTPEAPKLEGATVTVRDPITAQQVASAVTGIDGLASFPGLSEAWYAVDVSAPDHTVWRGNLFVNAGETNTRQAFLSKQLVTYTWTVEEVQIDDQYRISVETTFEANVAAPVVTVTPATIDVEDLPNLGDTKVIDMVIENHGLIDAEKSAFEFSSHPFYTLTPLTENLDKIPAQTSIVVPVMVKRVGVFAPDGSIETLDPPAPAPGSAPPARGQAPGGGRAEVPCGMGGRVRYEYDCGPNNVQKGTPITVSGVKGNCPGASANPAGAILTAIANNAPPLPSPPRPPDFGGSTGNTGFPGGGVSTFNGSTTSTGFQNTDDSVQETIEDDFSNISFSSSTPCDCPFGLNSSACWGSEISVAIPGIVSELTNTIGSALGATLDGIEFSVTAGGKVCVCCKDNAYGIAAEGEIKGEFKATLSFGPPQPPPLRITVGPWQLLDARIGGGAFQVITDIAVAVSLKKELGCDGKEKSCLTATGEIKTFAGARAQAIVRALYVPEGLIYTGTITGKLGLEILFALSGGWCSDKGGMIEKAAKLDAVAVLEGAVTVAERDGVDPDDGRPGEGIAGGTKFLSLGGRLSILDSTAPSNKANAPRAPRKGGGSPLDLDPRDLLADATPEPWDMSSAFLSTEEIMATPEIQSLLPSSADGTCAKVRMRLDNNAVMTRTAFRATLALTNNLPNGSLTEVGFDLDVRDENGNPAGDLFNIQVTLLDRVDTIDGTGTIAANDTGTAQWTLIPLDTAAPAEDTAYTVGGTINYLQEGVAFSIPVEAAPINVRPDAALFIKYFRQRDVVSDDPDTPQIEPAEPYFLAMQVCNQGAGPASNLRITSAQPSILDNEKGLLADFNITSTQIDGQGTSASLTADFGTIDPGSKKTAVWTMESSILGLFTDYSATFEHLDGFGDPRLSLLKEVEVHEMIRLVNALGAKDDGKPDFLTNDTPDPDDYPDAIHLSDGTIEPVALLETATTGGAALTYTIDFTAATGWTYLRIPDPSNGLVLTSVLRSDGLEIPVGSNTWTSDKTLVGLTQPPVYENVFHLVDCDSTGSYTLNFTELPPADGIAPESAVTMLDADSAMDIPVRWGGTDDDSGIAFFDIYVSIDGGPFELWLNNTDRPSAIYSGEIGKDYAFYSVATDFAGNEESAPATGDAATSVTISNAPPLVDAIDPQVVAEGDGLFLTVTADDPDGDNLNLRYSISSSEPNLIVNKTNGNVFWTTGEIDGGRTVTATVTVTDGGAPAASATVDFEITVLDENSAPIIDPVDPQVVPSLGILLIDLEGNDLDIPLQELAWSLGPDAPSGMTIDSASGLLSWSPDRSFTGSTSVFEVTLTDDGEPAASSTIELSVTVSPGDDEAPEFDTIPVVLWIKGDTYSTTISAFDPDGDGVTLAADTSTAPGSHFEEISPAGTGTLSWDLIDANPGDYAIPVTATANGAQADATLLIRIRENNLYWSWAAGSFGSAFDDAADFSQAEMNRDPDADNRTNIHELTFLTNPLKKDTVPIGVKLEDFGDVSVTTLTVHRRVGSNAFTRLAPLRSPDLTPGSWAPVVPSEFSVAIDARGDDDNRPASESVDIFIFNYHPLGIPPEEFYQVESSLNP